MTNQIFLFKGTAPGSENVSLKEEIFTEDYENGQVKQIVTGVTNPSLIPFLPKQPNGTAAIVIPGGSYKRQVLNLEGSEIAEWLNSIGITAFVLKHRMPFDGHDDGCNVPLQDAQRAIRLIRSSAAKYGIDANRIGVVGFSAGAHLAASLGTGYKKRVYSPADDIDSISARPDFMVLAYPEISKQAYCDFEFAVPKTSENRLPVLEKHPVDKQITADTPQAFLLVADDDPITPSVNCISFYLGLKRLGIPAELHIFKSGSHGFGLGKTKGAVASWTKLCEAWINSTVSK